MSMKENVSMLDGHEIRFFEKVIYSDNCWEWDGALVSKAKNNCYGIFSIKGKRRLTHRLSYEYFVSNLKDNEVCCHHCDNPRCVNPFHLFAGTRSDNTIDSIKKGRHFASSKTHCKNGHPLILKNIRYIKDKKGVYRYRMCRVCSNAQALQFYHKKKAKEREQGQQNPG